MLESKRLPEASWISKVHHSRRAPQCEVGASPEGPSTQSPRTWVSGNSHYSTGFGLGTWTLRVLVSNPELKTPTESRMEGLKNRTELWGYVGLRLRRVADEARQGAMLLNVQAFT